MHSCLFSPESFSTTFLSVFGGPTSARCRWEKYDSTSWEQSMISFSTISPKNVDLLVNPPIPPSLAATSSQWYWDFLREQYLFWAALWVLKSAPIQHKSYAPTRQSLDLSAPWLQRVAALPCYHSTLFCRQFNSLYQMSSWSAAFDTQKCSSSAKYSKYEKFLSARLDLKHSIYLKNKCAGC